MFYFLSKAGRAAQKKKQDGIPDLEATNKMLRKTLQQMENALEAVDKQNARLMKRLAQKKAIIVDLQAKYQCPHFGKDESLENCPLS